MNNDNNIERNKVVEIIFNQAMDTSTINNTTITLQQGSTTVNGSVDHFGTTARFTSQNALAAQADYTAKVSTGAKVLQVLHLLMIMSGVSQPEAAVNNWEL